MKKINILHVYKTALPESMGGVERFLDDLAQGTSQLGAQNKIFCLASRPAEKPIQFNGYEIVQAKQHLFFSSTGISFSAFRKFRDLSKWADVIHYHFPNPFGDLLHFSLGTKKASVITYHSDIIRQKWMVKFYQPLRDRFLQSADKIVATSPNYFKTSPVLEKFKDKLSVIPIGIDTDEFETPERERVDYWRCRLPQSFFLFVGAMRYYKGLNVLLDALKGTDIEVVLAGIGGIESEIKSRVTALGLKNIIFLGWVNDDDKKAILSLCEGFVFPSYLRSEAFGIALLEAAAAGKPLISCEIGTGTSYINIHEETGLVVQPGSPEELRNAMKYLKDHPQIAAKMGVAARTRAKTLFFPEKQQQAYMNLYRSLVDPKGYKV